MTNSAERLLEEARPEIMAALESLPNLPADPEARKAVIDKLYNHYAGAIKKTNPTGALPNTNGLDLFGMLGGDSGGLVRIIHMLVALFSGKNISEINFDDPVNSAGNYIAGVSDTVTRKMFATAAVGAYEAIAADPDPMVSQYAGVTGANQNHGPTAQRQVHDNISAAGLGELYKSESNLTMIALAAAERIRANDVSTPEPTEGPTSAPSPVLTAAVTTPATDVPAKG